MPRSGQREHRRRQPFVAGCDPDDTGRRRQRPNQSTHHDGGIVAIGQAVEHAGRALGPSVAGVAAVDRKRDRAAFAKAACRLADEQADFPVTGVVSERQRLAVIGAQPAECADDDVLLALQRTGIPPHADVLGESEQIAARLIPQHVRGERQPAGRAFTRETGSSE
jgi:hypothetical protein